MSKKKKWYRCTYCGVMISEKELVDGKCPYCRTSNIKESVPDVVLVKEKKKGVRMTNTLAVTEPYWYQNTWVFDDASMGLKKEPLEGRLEGEMKETTMLARLVGGGLSNMVNDLVKDIPNARSGFMLLLSSQPFIGYQVELSKVAEENGGCLYRSKKYNAEPWLSPALFRYFDTAPESLYVKAEPHRNRHEIIEEVVTLRDRVAKLEQMVGKLTLENEGVRRSKRS